MNVLSNGITTGRDTLDKKIIALDWFVLAAVKMNQFEAFYLDMV